MDEAFEWSLENEKDEKDGEEGESEDGESEELSLIHISEPTRPY